MYILPTVHYLALSTLPAGEDVRLGYFAHTIVYIPGAFFLFFFFFFLGGRAGGGGGRGKLNTHAHI